MKNRHKIRAFSAKQAKHFDRIAVRQYGISTLVLMETAGRHVADELIRSMLPNQKILFFCGKGNNGGDGFVAARHLLSFGIQPDIILAGGIKDVKNEAAVNLGILLKLKLRIIEAGEERLAGIEKSLNKYGLLVDALLGVGLEGKVRGIYCRLIDSINSASGYTVSVDIPSGLDADTGQARGCCVEADKTVTFVLPKTGMIVNQGPRYSGEIVVKDLGVPLISIQPKGLNRG